MILVLFRDFAETAILMDRDTFTCGSREIYIRAVCLWVRVGHIYLLLVCARPTLPLIIDEFHYPSLFVFLVPPLLRLKILQPMTKYIYTEERLTTRNMFLKLTPKLVLNTYIFIFVAKY